MAGQIETKSPIERFWVLVNKRGPDECWPWLGARNALGYGQFTLSARRGQRRVRIAPYRFIWEHYNGLMPEGTEPDHLCNNRLCCNPAHIEPVTHGENQKRSYQRGRARPGIDYAHPRFRPSHCVHGHAYTSKNKRINSQGAVVCRVCDRARCAAYQARRLVALLKPASL